jgi:hypothetical protein
MAAKLSIFANENFWACSVLKNLKCDIAISRNNLS